MVAGLALMALACRRPSAPPEPDAAPAVPPEPPAWAPPADASPTCGEEGLPDCPLAVWMDRGPNALWHRGEAAPLAAALRELASVAPPGYPDWERWAREGAARADASDLPAAKAACDGCHDAYRRRYRLELRSRPLSLTLAEEPAPPPKSRRRK
jgi:hypothetical protein